MIILNREDFLKLPTDVIFQKGVEWVFDEFYVKKETIGDDFYYEQIIDFDWKDSNEHAQALDDMLKNKTSRQLDSSIQRDGLFEDDERFMIIEKDDILKIIERLKELAK